jgi:hypothetical protein
MDAHYPEDGLGVTAPIMLPVPPLLPLVPLGNGSTSQHSSTQMGGLTRTMGTTVSTGTNSTGSGGRTQETQLQQVPGGQESVTKQFKPYLEVFAPF